jgi:hypothetical protein
MAKPPEKPAGPGVLSVDLIDSGKLYRAGSETPFTEENLPEHLKQYIATGQEDFFHPRERDFYNNPRPDCGVVYQPTGSDSQWTRRQARQVASVAQEQIYAEAEAAAANKLSSETEEALQDSHDKYSALMKAQLQHDRDAIDRLYESLEAEAKPQEMFLKRGAVFTAAKKVKPRPGEHVFARRPSGEYESVGIVDSEGQLPPEEITP